MWSLAFPMSISATHSGGLLFGFGPFGQILTVILMNPRKVFVLVDDGMLKLMTPWLPMSALPATPPRLSPMKSRPDRVTRIDAAFVTVPAFGNPPGRGVTPQPAQPLEHPPPLQLATMRTVR